jgi:hypothetical protein
MWESAVSRLILMTIWMFIASGVSPLNAQDISFTRDFEVNNSEGWKAYDLAFSDEPVNGDNRLLASHSIPPNHQGEWWVDSSRYLREPENQCIIQGDELTGSLESKVFTIPAGTLTFLVGGHSEFKTRIELIILNEGAAIDLSGFRVSDSPGFRAFFASGRDNETMREVSWNLDPYEGDPGYIRMVDDSRKGHITADHFQFISLPPHPCEVAGADPMHCEPPGHPHCGEPGAIPELCEPPPVECDKPGADPDHCLVPACEDASYKSCDCDNIQGLEKFFQLLYCYGLWLLLLLLILFSIVNYLFWIGISYKAHPGPGKASISPGSRLDPEFELRLRVVKDAGVQRASPPNDLVKKESREP